MNEKQLRTVVGNLRRVISPNPASRVSDAQLVERCLDRRDELAFEMLVWRHGSMVLNVCRRVLRDSHEAEDAFQATFLLFVRKLGSIGKREAVAAWLYKVAYRVALRARQRAALRRADPLPDCDRLPGGPALDDPAHRALWNDLRPVLDEEVNRLPEKFRAPFVLFYLEGMPYPEVAAELGCPKGTVSSRLTAAKGMLRKRLLRRGVALSATVLGAVLAKAAAAAMTVGLTISTMQTLRLIAGGPAAGAGAVSARAVALAEGVLKTMLMTKIKLAAALVLALGVVAFGTSLVVQHAVQAQPVPSPDTPGVKNPLPDPDAPPPKTQTVPDGGVTLSPPPAPKDDLFAPPAVQVQVPRTTPPYVTEPAPALVTTRPAAGDDALANRLAKIEQRLARLEAEIAKMQGKQESPKPKPDLYPADTKPYTTPPTTRPNYPSPDPRKPVDHSYGPATNNPFGGPPSSYGPATVAVPNVENIPLVNEGHFKLPIAVSDEVRDKIVEIALFVSTDEGKTWKKVKSVSPDTNAIEVTTTHDGLYWFTVQVLGKDKNLSPSDLHKAPPGLKVWVQTKPANEDKQTLLEDLEAQLKSIQKRIAELKARDEKPAKP